MKKNCLLLLLVVLYACSADEEYLLSDNSSTYKVSTRAITQSISPVFDWEDTSSIMLNGFGNVILPWYNAADTNIPYEILEDYKKEDGWEMVYNLCTQSAATTYGKYYLIFYNKLRGILRVYYYNVYNTTPATTTFWQLSFTKPTSMLNNIGHFTEPTHTNVTSNMYTTNISSVEAKGITRGWNCFDVELCYDPNSVSIAQKMGIRSYDVTQGKINIIGGIQLESEGTIVSTSQTPAFPALSNIIKTGVSAFGKSVKKFISNKLDSTKISPPYGTAIAEIISSGNTGLIKSGINLIFGSFLGKKTTTTQTLKVQTTGQIKNEGNFITNFNSNINPLVNLIFPGSEVESTDYFLPSYNEPLGLWNVAETPVVALSSGAIWYKFTDQEMYSFARIIKAKPVKIIVNPAAEKYFSKYEVSYQLMYYKVFNGNPHWGSAIYGYNYTTSDYYFNPIVGKEVYNDNGNEFLDSPHYSYDKVRSYPYLAQDYGRRQKEVWFLDDLPVENPNYVVKVSVTFYPKSPYDTTPIVSTRSYLPEYTTEKNLIDPNGW